MKTRTRLFWSILFVTLSLAIVCALILAWSRVPVIKETIRLCPDGIRDWTTTSHFGNGKRNGWRVIPQELPVCVLELPDGSYLLRYIEWSYEPARGFREFLLPEGSRILESGSASGLLNRAATNVRWIPKSAVPGKIDVSLHFLAEKASVPSIPATPPLLEPGLVRFRVQPALVQYQRSLFIRGEFTGWKSLPMELTGGLFEFRTRLAPGRYRYQIQYSYLAFSDPSVPGTLINGEGESMSEIVVP